MTAYYNEIDPYAAQWLRNLIAAGHIAAGVVDTRSIDDVQPDDLREFTQCHFFAGVGVWSLALRRAGWPDDRPVWTGSCPCQPFSAAGKGAAFADERHLWPAFHHLIAQRRPERVLGEQVASSAVDEWIDLVHADLEALGYAFGSVPFPSAGVGAPHIRDRNYWTAVLGNRRNVVSGRNVHALVNSSRPGLEKRIGIGRVPGRPAGRGARQAPLGASVCDVDGLANGNQYGCAAHAGAELHHVERHTEPCGGAGRLEHTVQLGRERGEATASGHIDDGAAPERAQGEHGVSVTSAHRIHQDKPGPTNGYWAAADWLGCRDGKWRPVESGTFPLAHGDTARVGRLRAYGNAINAEAARVFIEAVMEVT